MNKKMFRGGLARDFENSIDPISCLNRHIFSRSAAHKESSKWKHYFSPIAEISNELPVPLFGIMILIWQLRSRDLQKLYPLDTVDSKMDFLSWCLIHGKKEYRALQENYAWDNSLQCPANVDNVELDKPDAGRVFNWEMIFISRARTDLNFDISTVEGRNGFFVWYISHGASELHGEDWHLQSWQTDYLNKESEFHSLTNLQAIVYQVRPDLISAFPMPEEQSNYIAWCLSAAEFRQHRQSSNGFSRKKAKEDLPFGVNIVGYAFGQLGIGEDARMAAHALNSADVPVAILNFLPGNNIGQNEKSMESFVAPTQRYNTNLYCLTALEHARHFAENGADITLSGYNIGYWPWEISEWPEEWHHLFSLVDEVWVSSQHTYDAIAPVSTVPVKLMLMAVEIPEPNYRLTRADFGLPLDAFLYLFSFDLNSSIYRKNPEACIDAFLEAFSNSEIYDNVGLVIKIQRPNITSPEYSALKMLQEKDKRIFLVEETLTKPDLLALYKNCNVFVSLHRAEGFGRNIAEAMLLKRPVVVTAYSGNLAFNFPDNSFLVKASHVFIREDEYMHAEDMAWADPNILHASVQLRTIYDNKNSALEKALKGYRHISNNHNPLLIGRSYLERLASIYGEDFH